MNVSAHVQNTDDVIVAIQAEMTIAQWKYLLGIIHEVKYYGPLDALKNSVRDCVRKVEENVKESSEVQW